MRWSSSAKRGWSYRGKRGEAADTLDEDTIDHGNFWEIRVLLGNMSSVLRNTSLSALNKGQADTSAGFIGGRGNFVTPIQNDHRPQHHHHHSAPDENYHRCWSPGIWNILSPDRQHTSWCELHHTAPQRLVFLCFPGPLPGENQWVHGNFAAEVFGEILYVGIYVAFSSPGCMKLRALEYLTAAQITSYPLYPTSSYTVSYGPMLLQCVC